MPLGDRWAPPSSVALTAATMASLLGTTALAGAKDGAIVSAALPIERPPQPGPTPGGPPRPRESRSHSAVALGIR